MPLPQSAYELLALIASRGGRMLAAEIPKRLQNALAICRGEPLLVRVARVGTFEAPPVAYLTNQGRAELARHAESGEQRLPANEAKVKPEDVPAELRELGRREGPVLTATYLAMTGGWEISSVELTKAFKARELTYRLKVGNAYAYLYTELFRLRERRAERKDKA
jgi:hypothetical protein